MVTKSITLHQTGYIYIYYIYIYIYIFVHTDTYGTSQNFCVLMWMWRDFVRKTFSHSELQLLIPLPNIFQCAQLILLPQGNVCKREAASSTRESSEEAIPRSCSKQMFRYFLIFCCKFQFKRSLEHIGALKPYPNQKVQFLLRWCLEPWATQKRSIHYTSLYIPFVELTWFQRTILWDPVGKFNYTYSTISSMFLNIFRISFPTPPSYQKNTFYPALWLNIFVHEFSTKNTNTHNFQKTITLPETNIAHENHNLYWKIPSKL